MTVPEDYQVLDTVQARTDRLNLLARAVNNLAQRLDLVQLRLLDRLVVTYPTTERPSASSVSAGTMIYDRTLNLPLWSDGQYWADATGAYR